MQASLGSITTHNMVSRDGRRLLVANYGMGSGGPGQSVVVFGIRPDGGLTPPIASVQLDFCTRPPDRGPHRHWPRDRVRHANVREVRSIGMNSVCNRMSANAGNR
jgi:6-phosphogluconolactonase